MSFFCSIGTEGLRRYVDTHLHCRSAAPIGSPKRHCSGIGRGARFGSTCRSAIQGDRSLDSTKLSNNPSLVIVCLVPAGQPASVGFSNKSPPCDTHRGPRPTASASRIYLVLVAPAPYLPYRLVQDLPLPPRPAQQLLPSQSTRNLRSICALTSRCSYILISRYLVAFGLR